MDPRLFFSTFILIFLAELGDKTQLAAMAQAAGARAPWSVFLGASAALVLSTLLAVLLGGVLERYVPVAYIRGAAGVLFLVFGVLLLRNAWSGEEVALAPVAAPVSPAGPGMLAAAALDAAAAFEAAAAADYRRLAAAAGEDLRNLYLALAEAEEGHLRRLRAAAREHAAEAVGAAAGVERLTLPAGVPSEAAAGILREAAEHELKTARFYAELGKGTVLPALRQVFADLAREEEGHARQLTEAAG